MREVDFQPLSNLIGKINAIGILLIYQFLFAYLLLEPISTFLYITASILYAINILTQYRYILYNDQSMFWNAERLSRWYWTYKVYHSVFIKLRIIYRHTPKNMAIYSLYLKMTQMESELVRGLEMLNKEMAKKDRPKNSRWNNFLKDIGKNE